MMYILIATLDELIYICYWNPLFRVYSMYDRVPNTYKIIRANHN